MAVIGAGTVEDLAIAGDHVVAMIEVIVLEIKIDEDHLVIVKEKVVGEMRLNLKISQKKQLPWLKESKKLLKKQGLLLLAEVKNFVKTQEEIFHLKMNRHFLLGNKHLLQQPSNKFPTKINFTKKIMLIFLQNQNKYYLMRNKKQIWISKIILLQIILKMLKILQWLTTEVKNFRKTQEIFLPRMTHLFLLQTNKTKLNNNKDLKWQIIFTKKMKIKSTVKNFSIILLMSQTRILQQKNNPRTTVYLPHHHQEIITSKILIIIPLLPMK